MPVLYLDPYKDDKYGKLKGDKAQVYFGVTFDEAIIYKTEDAYIIAGYVTKYTAITRNFKPENSLEPGLCAVPIYGKEYEIRNKSKDGEWSSTKITPSLFEKVLYDAINKDEGKWMPSDKAISLSLIHIPDGMLMEQSEEDRVKIIEEKVKVSQVNLSGKLPEYTPPLSSGQRKGWGGAKSLTPDEKVAFLKKQLAEDIKADGFKEGRTLADLTDQMLVEHADDDSYITVYFEMLIACVR